MKNLQTLKLSASSIGSAAPRSVETAPTQEIPVAEQRAPRAPMPGLKKRLVALFAVELAATLAAVAAQGSVHSTIFRVAAAGLALTVASVVGIETFAPRRRAHAAPAASAARPPVKKSFNKTRVALLFMMAIGFATYFGGGGTWSSFSAQTNNPNSTIASGSLLLQNTINTLCESKSGVALNNVNYACNTAFTVTNQQPGVFSATKNLTLTNSGTLDAAKAYLFAPYANGTLASYTTTGAPNNYVNSITLTTSSPGPNGMEGTVSTGDSITVASGASTQTFTVTGGPYAGGSTTINVNATQAANGAMTAGATVDDTSTNSSVDNTNCYDAQVTNLTFNVTTHNPLCQAATLFVQEVTGGKHYCWWGSGTGTKMCDIPISVNPSSAPGTIAAGTYNISTAGGLNGNIKSGDRIAFTEGANQAECTASTDYYASATSIVLTSTCATIYGSNSGFTTAAVITDLDSLARVAADGAHSISQFDTTKKSTTKLELSPVTADGTITPSAIDMAAGATRNFVLGIIIPGTASNQNVLQALKSTFGISWQLSQ